MSPVDSVVVVASLEAPPAEALERAGELLAAAARRFAREHLVPAEGGGAG